MKAYWGSGCIAPLIRWPRHYMEMSSQLHTPAALPPGKELQVPIGYECEWVRSGRGGEEKNSQPPPGIEP
jgi:hypothetical protein